MSTTAVQSEQLYTSQGINQKRLSEVITAKITNKAANDIEHN